MKNISLFALTAAALLPVSVWSQTMNVDAASLIQRLERTEQRLSTLENRRSSSATGTLSGPTGSALADMEERMSLLERQGDQVNGGVERLSHAVEQLAKQLDLMNKDMDARLTALEQKGSTPAPKPAAATPESSHEAAEKAEKEPDSTPTSSSATASPTTPSGDVPAGLSATEHYNKAYAYLTAADYPNAIKWLDAFTKRFPNDKLSDNAWYWLGEVHLVNNQPDQALIAFKEGLQKFPKGAKAPANLYKMGMSFQQLKQDDLAKVSWEKLTKDYPNAPETAKAKQKLAELKKAEPAKEEPKKTEKKK